MWGESEGYKGQGSRGKQQGRGPSWQEVVGRRVAEITRRGHGTDKGAGSALAARSGARISRKSLCILKTSAMETDARSRILCARALDQEVRLALGGWAGLGAVRYGVWVRRLADGVALRLACRFSPSCLDPVL